MAYFKALVRCMRQDGFGVVCTSFCCYRGHRHPALFRRRCLELTLFFRE